MQTLGDSRVRRVFGFLALFDLTASTLLYMLAAGSNGHFFDVFLVQEAGVNPFFQRSLLDVWILSAIRSGLCLYIYMLQRRRPASLVVLSTVFTCVYLIVKMAMFDFSVWSASEVFAKMVVLAAFGLAWVDFYIWFISMRGEVEWAGNVTVRDVSPRQITYRVNGDTESLLSGSSKARRRYGSMGVGEYLNVGINDDAFSDAGSDVSFKTADDDFDGEGYEYVEVQGDSGSDHSSVSGAHMGRRSSRVGSVVGNLDALAAVLDELDSEGSTRRGDFGSIPACEYSSELQEALEVVEDAMNNNEGWKLENGEAGVTVHKKKYSNKGVEAVKGCGMVKAPPDMIFDFVMDANARVTYDPVITTCQVPDRLNDQTDLVYFTTHGVWPAAPRDFCTIRAWTRKSDGTYLIVLTSVESDLVPVEKDHTRGYLYFQGIQIVPLDADRCEVTVAVAADPKGWLPPAISALAFQRQAMVVAQIQRILTFTVQTRERLISQLRAKMRAHSGAAAAGATGASLGHRRRRSSGSSQHSLHVAAAAAAGGAPVTSPPMLSVEAMSEDGDEMFHDAEEGDEFHFVYQPPSGDQARLGSSHSSHSSSSHNHPHHQQQHGNSRRASRSRSRSRSRPRRG